MSLFSFAQGEYITIPNYRQDVQYSKEWRVIESRYYDNGACANWLHRMGYTTYGDVGEWQRPPSSKDFGANTYSIFGESCSYEEGHGYGYLEHYERIHYFRELSGKVYRYVEEEEKEYCVLDFNLSVGDIFTRRDGVAMRVVETGRAQDYPNYNEETESDRKLIRLQSWDDPSIEDVWIEGIGSIYTGILDDLDFESKKRSVLSCSDNSQNTFFEVKMDNYKYVEGLGTWFSSGDYEEFLAKTATDEELKDTVITRFPYIKNIEFLDDTLHVTGIYEGRNDKYSMSAEISNGYVTLLLSAQQSYENNFYKFDAKIPGFEPGTYTIYYFNRDWLDRDVVLTCEGLPATSIPNVKTANSEQKKTQIYDLSGRQLKAEPEHGIYIKDGRKYVK